MYYARLTETRTSTVPPWHRRGGIVPSSRTVSQYALSLLLPPKHEHLTPFFGKWASSPGRRCFALILCTRPDPACRLNSLHLQIVIPSIYRTAAMRGRCYEYE